MKRPNISITIVSATPQATQVLLEGQLVVSNTETLKGELLGALKASESIELVFKNIIKMDLTAVQILLALQKSAFQLKKKIFFDFELPEHINLLLENSGFASLIQTKR